MAESVLIAVEESSKTAEARRIARRMAEEIGMDETAAEKVSIVVTEACTNLVKHAGGGELLVRTTAEDDPRSPARLEVLVLDRGPGIANLELCLRDGYSTGGTPGHGLGAIVRLSSASDFYSALRGGTAVLARWSPGSSKGKGLNVSDSLQMGAINVCKPGEEVCGDAWGVEQTHEYTTVVLADGLGHGLDAKTAALEAVRIVHSHPDLLPGASIERIHQALRATRGAAVAVARIDRVRGVLAFAGVGNIAAQIYSGAAAGPRLVSVNGTAGHHVHSIREFSYPWPDKGILFLYSDGLSTSTTLDAYPGLALCDPSLIAGVLFRDFSRRTDDATVVVAKAA